MRRVNLETLSNGFLFACMEAIANSPLYRNWIGRIIKKLIWIALVLFILAIVGAGLVKNYAYTFLAREKPVDAQVLVVEAWLPTNSVREAARKFLKGNYTFVATVGGQRTSPYLPMMNGGTLMYTPELFSNPVQADSIHVQAWGSSVLNEFAHFQVWVNDTLVGQTYVEYAAHTYTFPIKSELGPVQKLDIVYDNDLAFTDSTGGHDRNFFIGEVALGEMKYLPYSDKIYYAWGDTMYTQLWFYPEESAKVLMEEGVPKDKIVVIPVTVAETSRTYQNAVAFSHWMQKHPELNSVNIVSQAAHTRRSYLMYRRNLKDSIKIGSMALKDRMYDHYWYRSRRGRKLIIDQYLKYIYALIFIH